MNEQDYSKRTIEVSYDIIKEVLMHVCSNGTDGVVATPKNFEELDEHTAIIDNITISEIKRKLGV